MYYLSIRPDHSVPHIPSEILRLYENRVLAEKFGEICAEFHDYSAAVSAFVDMVYNCKRIAGTYPRIQNGGIHVSADHEFPCPEIIIVESAGVWDRRHRNGGDRVYTSALHQAIMRASVGDYDAVYDCGDGQMVMLYTKDVDTVIYADARPDQRHAFLVALRSEL